MFVMSVHTLGLLATPSRSTVILIVVALWLVSGLIIGLVVSRRGHHLAAWLSLGVALGPLSLLLWRSDRTRVEQPRTVVHQAGAPGQGGVTLLVGIDGSAAAEHALQVAVQLFAGCVGRLVLAEVLDYDTATDALEPAAASDRLAAVAALQRAADCIEERCGTTPTLVTLAGNPATALAHHAQECGATVLVVGPRGHGWSERLLGSTAASLTSGCGVPVLVISPPTSSG